MSRKVKIFIDGSEGTTGLRIHERFAEREDVELLPISSELRKDKEERKRLINSSDITFLCLPDAAAEESVSLVENDHVRIIDTSTAHRTMEGWAYGFPELSKEHREAIAAGNRIAVPGCYATGFISLVYPMVAEGLISADYPVSAFGISGYSGGGRKMIAAYEAEEREDALLAPREYALSQAHKHLKEMKKIPGLKREPLFSPIVADYYSGMVVSVPVYTELMNKGRTPQEVWKYLADFYAGSCFVRVMPFGAEEASANMLAGNAMSGRDSLRIYVTGNEDRVLLSSQFDNLGKGASGAAIQCLNIALGCEESKGLHL
ncbi:N-acetyl-gamma-glutamyl-phosphate reductase [Suilimivivens aceti]|uniref:N-acetyl-gamma-glutamyl-phosphate reductase n=1 Tax=Suilimivivens aceti TaxID=2981774 RepID=A0ABT2T2K8_9FIRM|nr:N-acetyl-gamma-glutamyl-phosphate reductase [Suilimivivens aceti]MCU6744484.1 N-acetyl-gamma-glutamyl-phosphate reductase [Suilimivivens aceti]SCH77163.1 N-acetyl-gamma-glutamyl-phosphate reductase [uncultured Clostridium sp.]